MNYFCVPATDIPRNVDLLLNSPQHIELKALIDNTLATGLNQSNCVIHHDLNLLKNQYNCKNMETEKFYSELTKEVLKCKLQPQAFVGSRTFSPYFDTDCSPIFGETHIVTFFYAKDNDLLNIVVGIPSMSGADMILIERSKPFPLNI
jgi:hypothetical protein